MFIVRLLVGVLLALAPFSVRAQLATADPQAAPTDPGWRLTQARPESAGRLTKFFSFDEPTPNPVPNFWYRAQSEPKSGSVGTRDGFPPTNLAELDDTIASSGTTSVRLPTRGGSTSLQLSPGVIPIFSGADYRVSAKVRTAGLVHARAVLTARLLDASSKPIPGAQILSTPTLSEGAWSDVSILLPGDFPDAAYLQIELQVLQPRQLRDQLGLATNLKHVSLPQDFSGAAWFDDIAVTQLAKIELVTDEPTNVFVAPETPILRARIRDLTGETLRGRVSLIDLTGREVDVIDRVLGAGRAEMNFTPKLPGYGWYRATFEVVSEGKTVGAAWIEFVVLPPDNPATRSESVDMRRLVIALSPMSTGADPATLQRLVDRLGAGALTIPIWTSDLTREAVASRASALAPLIDGLLAEYRDLTFVLSQPPMGSLPTEGLSRVDPWTVLEQEKSVYWPFLDQFLDRFGQRVRRWQIGDSGSETTVWRKDLTADLDKLSREVGQLISGPILGVGSRVEFSVPPASIAAKDRPGFTSALIGPDLPAQAAADAVRAWRDAANASTTPNTPPRLADYTLLVERPAPELYGREAGVGDTCRKLLHAWIASSKGASKAADRANDTSIRLGIDQPWVWVGARALRPFPTPQFAAFRTLADMLIDRVAIGEFPAQAGVRCVILAPAANAPAGRGGALVLWNESASAEDATFEAHLGSDDLWLVDHFGNRRKLQSSDGVDRSTGDTVISSAAGAERLAGAERPAPTVKVAVPVTPIFIEGIDYELVRLISSVRLAPDFLPATTQRKDLTIEFDNPWPSAISGEITIVEPVGGGVSADGLDRSWKIVPRVIRFAVGPHEHASLPVSVAFGGLEEAGRRDFVYLMDLSAERRLKGIRIRTPVEIGLKHIKLDLTPSLSPTVTGPDVVVEVQVTNLGESPLDLELTAFAPKRPRAGATVGGLQPGHQAVRRFVFPGAAAALRGQKVLVSVTEPDGGARLNASTVIP